MSQKELSQLWNKSLLARPDPRDVRKTMHLSAYPQGTASSPVEGMHLIQYQTADVMLFEIKGRPPNLHLIDLPTSNNKMLWLCIQLLGKTVFPNGRNIYADNMLSFMKQTVDYQLTLGVERQWILFFGLSGNSKLQLLAELPALRQAFQDLPNNILQSVPISSVERQVIEGLCKKALGPFNALYQTGVAVGKLFANYTQQLVKPKTLSREEFQVQIYHRALAYIQEHYLAEDLTREKIADILGCSIRNLTRAFEGRSLGVKATVMNVRLYKGRELLQTQPDLSVEHIAGMLHFWDAKHFAMHYKKVFRCSPRDERKANILQQTEHWIKSS